MKKVLSLSLLILASIFLTAAIKIPNFTWNAKDSATIDGYIKFLNENGKDGNKDYDKQLFELQIMKALVGKSDKTITYVEFKNIIFDVAKAYAGKVSTEYINWQVPRFTYNCANFRGFVLDAFNDKSLGSYSATFKNQYMFNLIYSKVSIEDFNTVIFENIKKAVKVDNPKLAVTNLKYFQTRLLDNPNAKVNLKKFKVLVYPKIQNSEEWKEAAVLIELMLKSLE